MDDSNNSFWSSFKHGCEEIASKKKAIFEELSTKVFQLTGTEKLTPPCHCTFVVRMAEKQEFTAPNTNQKFTFNDSVLDYVLELQKHELCDTCKRQHSIVGTMSQIINGLSEGGVVIHVAQTFEYNRKRNNS